MSTPTNGGGPAFPTVSASVHLPHHGMSLRTYFAGQAMIGLLSNNETAYSPAQNAQDAIQYADALIAELGKETA